MRSINCEVLNIDEVFKENTDNDRVVHFPCGIVGFDECERFVLYRLKNEKLKGLIALESLDIESLRFVAIPTNYNTIQEFSLLKEEDISELLDVTKITPKNLMLLYLVTIQKDGKIFFNQRAPIVIDMESKEGTQIILDDSYNLSVDILDITNIE